jgi:hypothetical protein
MLDLQFWQAVAAAWSHRLSATERAEINAAVTDAVQAQRAAVDPNRRRVSSALSFLLADDEEDDEEDL